MATDTPSVEALLEPFLFCQGRLHDLIRRLDDDCCPDDDLRAAAAAVDRCYRRILKIGQTDGGEDRGYKAVLKALRRVIDTGEELSKFVPERPSRVALGEHLFLPQGLHMDVPLILRFDGPPPPNEPPWWYWELSPDDVRRLFERLIEILRQIEAQVTDPRIRDQIRAMITALTGYLARLAQGGKIYFHDLWRWLVQNFLARLGPLLRGMGRAGVRFALAIASAIWAWLEAIGVSLGAEAGGAAVAAGGAFIAAMIAALIGGYFVGKWIGSLKHDDKTVDDWLTDGIFLYYFDDPDGCEDLWDEYIRARAARVAYESSGPTLDKSVVVPLIAAEVRILTKYLAGKCPDNGAIRKALERLQKRLKDLTG